MVVREETSVLSVDAANFSGLEANRLSLGAEPLDAFALGCCTCSKSLDCNVAVSSCSAPDIGGGVGGEVLRSGKGEFKGR